MDKSKVFIASSSKALTLADKLKEGLNATALCEAKLWNEESLGQASSTIIEMLEEATASYDFAIIVLAKDDVIVKDTGETLKARDNCVFEAGLFMGALGRTRCFLVNSVKQSDLPTDLGGVISIPILEPSDLTDRKACGNALETALAKIKDVIDASRREGVAAKNKSLVNLLTWKDLIDKESLDSSRGGTLEEGQVVVTAIQPIDIHYHPALQVRNNINRGVSYVYFFHGDASGAQKICRLLQMVLLSPLFADETEANNFDARLDRLRENKDSVLASLRSICMRQTIQIVALSDPPVLQYCIHNANNVDSATVYLKYEDKFLEWARGKQGNEFWKEVRQIHTLKPKETLPLFYETAELSGKMQTDYYNSIDEQLAKYFPEIDDKVRNLCIDGLPRKK